MKRTQFSGKTKNMAFSRRGEPGSSSTFSAETPSHFFKVVLPSTLQDKKLRIPEKFVRKFGDELSAVAKVMVPNCHAWYLGLTKDREKMWFNDGWHDFVNYFSISAGYFLVFRYGKNSEFHVIIFDQTACEIRYPYYRGGPENDENNSLHQDEMKIGNSVEIMPLAAPDSPSNSLKNKAFDECGRDKPSLGLFLGTNRCRKCGASFESASARKRKVKTNEREREEIEAANAFESANPFCRVVMRPSYLSTMCLPSCFSQKHLNRVSGIINLQLSDGRQWPVRCIYRGHRAKLSQGWRKFRSDNHLRKGDVCVFEVLRSSDIVLKVTVFRVPATNRCGKCVETPKFRHPDNLHSSIHDEHEEEVKTQFRLYGSASTRKRKVRTNEREREEINTANEFESANPFCRVVMRPSYLYTMCLPSCFSQKYLNGFSRIINLQLSDGKQWPVRCMYKRHRAIFSHGWRGFILDNNLAEGDVCVFELLRSSDVVLKVTVFRVLESANLLKGSSFGSARGIKRSQKGVGSSENPKLKHGIDMLSKRCKIEELDEIYKSDAAGDGSELIKAKHKVEAHSSDEEKERAKFHELELLSLLEDMGISVSRNFRHIAEEERARATAAARLFKPKHPSFMVILQLDNLKHRRLHVPSTFGNKYLSKDSQCIKVQDSDGREWPLQLFWSCQFFFKKCTAFYREKNLGEGDLCIFELIRVKEPLLKVSILYASKKVHSYR